MQRCCDGPKRGGDRPQISPDHPAYFYCCAPPQDPDKGLVNMLLSELSPLDVRQLSICHKGPFYHSYGRWSDAKRGWVADVLEREYKFDKAGAGAALFGPEPAMDETSPPGHTGPSTGTPVQAVGP